LIGRIVDSFLISTIQQQDPDSVAVYILFDKSISSYL